MSHDTIFALATPAGKSGVAVLRISGEYALHMLQKLTPRSTIKPRYAYYESLKNPFTGMLIDNCLCLYFKAPHSFTGEDVVEIHCHGSKAVIEELTELFLTFDMMRYAEAGEFTRRAFYNGKMDYVQVESLHDLIEAETPKQKSVALDNLNGTLSRKYESLYASIVEARAFCEVFLDFPDDDLPETLDSDINEKIQQIAKNIEVLLQSADYGRRLREGVKVAIIGKPNVGKSTLLNALAERDAAIVSDIAGTTRDIIEVAIDIDGQTFVFFDTAGLRESHDEIEKIGIHKARTILKECDLFLLLSEANEDSPCEVGVDVEHIPRIYVLNKVDKSGSKNVSRETLAISAREGTGINSLKKAISSHFSNHHSEEAVITRVRHVKHLQLAKNNIYDAMKEQDLIIKATHLIYAGNELLSIIGRIDFEDILDSLFSSFCIGK
jgi:tRNA modification GTPase